MTYEQSTGRLYRAAKLIGTGYSGREEAKNQPDLDSVRDRGPIPRGRWRVGKPFDSQSHGPFCLPLSALPGTEAHHRSGFLMHGDSRSAPGTASHGCIIMPRAVRELVAASGEDIEVIPTVNHESAIAGGAVQVDPHQPTIKE